MKELPTVPQSLRSAAKSFLDGRINRRSFVSRLAQLGVAASATSSLAAHLLNPSSRQNPEPASVFKNLTGGELTAEFLRLWDVSYVFGLGGSEEVGFLDALVDRLDLHYVLGLHEGSVMSMADGFARASGKTAFLNLHSVAGTGYALGPMVNAFKDRTPVVITAGRQSSKVRGSQAFLEAANLHMLPREYTQWTWDVLRPDSIPETLRRAFLLARIPPGGPTFVTFSKDFWEEHIAEATILPPSRSEVDLHFGPRPEKIHQTVEMLLAAEFPLLIAGREVATQGGAEHLAEIAELLGAAVMADVPASHSPIGFPTRHAHYTGLFTMEPDWPPDFDLFWSVGGTMFTLFGPPSEPIVPPQTRTIHSSIEPARIGRNYPVDLAVTGHSARILEAVAAELKKRSLNSSLVQERGRVVQQFHSTRKARTEAEARRRWNESPISPERLAMELNDQMTPDATVVSELATSDFFLWKYLDLAQSPQGRLHLTSAGGCLGWGLGAAIGAKIGRPDNQTVLLVGDGSFQFGVQALWSAARYQVPVAVIIWNNQAYQANRRALYNYGRRAAETGKYIGCHLGHPDIDFSRVAEGYGIEAERVSDPARLSGAIDRCLRRVDEGYPYVLDVGVQPRFGGASSTWYDFFSIRERRARES